MRAGAQPARKMRALPVLDWTASLRVPPASETDLLARAEALAGRTVGELAAALGTALPVESRRAKGFVGELVERALGAPRSSASRPDFAELGVELKTIPLTASGQPRESTFVCSAPLREIAAEQWSSCGVRRKLARVLWVPIEAIDGGPLQARRIGRARLWSPTAEEEALLRADWEELAGVIGRGDVELLTAHSGQVLQLRPKGRNSRQRTRGADEGGAALSVAPRGFYLRASFTARLFAE